MFSIITMVFAALSLFFTLSTGITFSSDSSLASRSLNISSTLPKWVGTSKGVNITLYGNAESIMQQLQDLDPDWVPAASPPSLSPPSPDGIETYFPVEYCCPVAGQSFNWVNRDYTVTAAARLNSIGGSFTLDGPFCSVVSCYLGSGIVMCNQNSGPNTAASSDLAFGGQNIANGCPVNSAQQNCGQIFSDAGWNAIVNSC